MPPSSSLLQARNTIQRQVFDSSKLMPATELMVHNNKESGSKDPPGYIVGHVSQGRHRPRPHHSRAGGAGCPVVASCPEAAVAADLVGLKHLPATGDEGNVSVAFGLLESMTTNH